jgi:hypothetical protein
VRELRIELYDKDFQQVGTIGDPKYVTAIPRFNTGGQAMFGVRSNHHRIEHVITRGTRAVLVDENDDVIHSGRIGGYRSAGPERGSVIEVDVKDDFDDVFRSTLGWVVPANAITAQGTAGTNWVAEGPAETVLRLATVANAIDRLGRPLTFPASLGRGDTVKARLRMQSLYDRLFPVVDGAGIVDSGIGVRVYQQGSGLLVDIWEPRTVPQVLSEGSGVIRTWSYTHDHPSATRVVVGGQGEGTLRLWRERVDAIREADMGVPLETFRDARDTDDPTEMYERADEMLKDGDQKTGLSIELSETANFRYRTPQATDVRGFSIGDVVNLQIGAVSVEERLREVTLSQTAEGGFTSRPRVGDRQEDPDRTLANKLKSVIRSIRSRNSEV